jgi:hypothetical protein
MHGLRCAVNQEAYVYIPEDLRQKIPALYASENEPNPTVWVKLFTPDSSWTWYVMEYDGVDTCFGLVQGLAVELGYFSLAEIVAARGPLGLRVERDLFFKPAPLEEVRQRGQ